MSALSAVGSILSSGCSALVLRCSGSSIPIDELLLVFLSTLDADLKLSDPDLLQEASFFPEGGYPL